ncbi:hypothetical protein N802_01395 [Knoellia sinensis KCTC 19936]|uniref:Uncharacterized protein n=1 Tax=Knoellia sinensis KCTC 19936 TaxID=1385520 RepID=A0A0A0JHC6_9MICO|nr:hypothetical protein [Knoellia sinensis]KGN35026.1 hypothetical protein N802_01395 [Knoellia sinensis KCTC 19936]
MTSRSQHVLQGVLALTSLGLAALTLLTASSGSFVLALVVVAVTPFVALEPGSRLTALLLGLHGAHWLTSHTVPDTAREWALVFVTAAGMLVIHLAASLACTLPKAAPIPRASVRRWLARAVTVLALSLPVWALLVAQSAALPDGDAVATYGAIAALGILAFALWLAQQSHKGQSAMAPKASALVSSTGISSSTDSKERSS